MAKKLIKSGGLPAKSTPKDATPAKLLADLRVLIVSTRTGILGSSMVKTHPR